MKKIRLDQSAITLGDLEDFEEITGSDLFEVMKPRVVICEGPYECEYDHPHKKGKPIANPADEKGRPLLAMKKPTAKQMTALVYIFGKKTNPGLTLAKARELKVATELQWDVDETTEDEGLDPTKSGDDN